MAQGGGNQGAAMAAPQTSGGKGGAQPGGQKPMQMPGGGKPPGQFGWGSVGGGVGGGTGGTGDDAWLMPNGIPQAPAAGGAAPGAQPNMFQNAANASNMAMAAAARETGFNPMMVQAGQLPSGVYGYNANTMGPAAQINLNDLGGAGGASAHAEMLDTNMGDWQAAQVGQSDIDRFMNPYTDSVVDQSMADIQRMSDQQRNQLGAEATAAGAFGGSRGALMQSEALRNAGDTFARSSGDLRRQGFSDALANAQQDVNRRQQANMGTAANRMGLGQGNQQAGLQASIASANNATQAGIAGMGNRLAALTNNMNALNDVSSFNAGVRNAADQFNIGNRMNRDQFNINTDMTAQQINQGAQLAGAGHRLSAANNLSNIGNTGFNQANTVNANMIGAGGLEQSLLQQIMSGGQSQFGQYGTQMGQSLGFPAGTLGLNAGGTNTSSSDPGLFGWASLMLSDVRLKKNIQPINGSKGDFQKYTWEWNEKANDLGLYGFSAGVIAQEVQEKMPEAVYERDDGYLMVDYGRIAA